MLNKCSTCDALAVLSTHVCPPKFLIWCPYEGDEETDARAYYAHSAEAAAALYAERYDRNDDYPIAGGNIVTVHVKVPDGSVKKFSLSGEMVPEYAAKEIE